MRYAMTGLFGIDIQLVKMILILTGIYAGQFRKRGNKVAIYELSETRPVMSAPAAEVLDHLQTARAQAYGHQHEAGRGKAGRAWSILITKLEELEALTRYYETNPGLGVTSWLGAKEVEGEE